MNTFQLACFLAVAETLNFARAAELLNVTQPAVTHQIHTLESELNVKLFKRTTRSVALTQAGQIFIGDARNMVLIAERAKRRFEDPADQEIQPFSMGCHSNGPLFLLPEILRNLAEVHPNIHPQLTVVPYKHLYRLLVEGDVDVVVSFRENNSKKAPFLYKELRSIPVVGYCAETHPLAGHTILTKEDLDREVLILKDPRKTSDKLAELLVGLLESHPASEIFFCDSEEVAVTFALAGYGIAILPELFIPQELSLSRIPIHGLELLSFGVYYKTLSGNPLLKDFIHFAQAGFAGQR